MGCVSRPRPGTDSLPLPLLLRPTTVKHYQRKHCGGILWPETGETSGAVTSTDIGSELCLSRPEDVDMGTAAVFLTKKWINTLIQNKKKLSLNKTPITFKGWGDVYKNMTTISQSVFSTNQTGLSSAWKVFTSMQLEILYKIWNELFYS